MSVMLDIIGSVIITGILMATVLQVNVNLSTESYSTLLQLNSQLNAVVLAQIIEHDFYRIGYSQSGAISSAITSADSQNITFKADIDNSGTINTVSYALGTTSEAAVAATPNPRDRILRRTVDGGVALGGNLGITSFRLTYYDTLEAIISSPSSNLSKIKSIKVQITIESPYPVTPGDSTYVGAYWEKLVFPRNL